MWASSDDINKKRRELRHGAEHDSIEQHGSGRSVCTLCVEKLMGQGLESPLCTCSGS